MNLMNFHMDYRKKRVAVIIFGILLLLMLYFFQNASTLFRVISTIFALIVFYSIDHVFDIRFRHRHYVFITLILVFSLLLSPLYFLHPQYDKIQHFVQPILLCSIIFYMANRLILELKWKIVFTFFTVVAILGLFEISEFALDSFFNLKLQGVYLRDTAGFEKFNLLLDPLKDTMIDMIYGVIGAGIYCIGIALRMRKKLQRKIFREI